MSTRIVYAQELSRLTGDVSKMGALLEEAIKKTSLALSQLDSSLARAIIEEDSCFDRMEREIERECLDLVVKQAPVASDWRRIASIMRIIADLERIADHCSDISEYIILLAQGSQVHPPDGFEQMFGCMKQMVADTIDSFVRNDVAAANHVLEQDDEVDHLFGKIKEELCEMMEANPQQIPQYVNYLMIDKYIERMADHSTNVAGWIPFIVEGTFHVQ